MLTADFQNKVIHSDGSISDIVVFHGQLRDIESSEAGMMYPVIHTYKQVDLGGGALFPAVEFINGWTIQFPVGNYTISGGNLKATINPVAGCYVKQTQSAAYAVTAGSGGSVDLSGIAEQLTAIQNSMATKGDVYAASLL